jgi:hypothetical protein
VAVRTTQRFARPGLRVSEASKDTRTSHYHESETGSYASLRPYRGCFCRHPGGLSSFLAAIGLALSICPYHAANRDFRPDSVAAALLLRRGARLVWLCVAPKGIKLCNLDLVSGTGRLCPSPFVNLGMRCASIRCYRQLLDAEWDYSMTPAKPCFQHRRRSAIRRSGRLPNQRAVRARDRSHRGSL